MFDIQENRNLAEYVYRVDSFSTFSGKALKKRWQEVNQFRAEYGARVRVTQMMPDDIAEVLAFEHERVRQNGEAHDILALEREERFGIKMLQNFEAFHLAGVVLQIDDRVRGFSFGTKLNDTVFDGLLEKGDRNVLNAYQILHMELAKQRACGCSYEKNIEEDLGILSLRSKKLQYQPDHLIEKFVASEK